MLYREIFTVCSQIHTKHINTVCGQNVELLNVKLVVHIVTTGLWRFLAEFGSCVSVRSLNTFPYIRKHFSENQVEVHRFNSQNFSTEIWSV